MDNTLYFRNLQVGDTFCIPYHLDNGFERFVKLPFNKARCIVTNTIHEFSSQETVWLFEPTSFDTN